MGIQGLIPLQKWTRQPTAVFQTSCTAYRGREGRAMGLKPPVENFYLPPNKVGEAYSKLWAQLDIMCLIKVHFKIKTSKTARKVKILDANAIGTHRHFGSQAPSTLPLPPPSINNCQYPWLHSTRETGTTRIFHHVRGTHTRIRTIQLVPDFNANFWPRTTTSFAVAGPRVWNSLPPAIRDPSLSPSIFGKLLKTYLFV